MTIQQKQAGMNEEMLEEALYALLPEFEVCSGTKENGILRLVVRVQETPCDLVWIKLRALIVPVETRFNSPVWRPTTSVSRVHVRQTKTS